MIIAEFYTGRDMNVGTLWFDRLRNKLREEIYGKEGEVIPGLLDEMYEEFEEILDHLNGAEPLIVSGDVSRKIAPNGEPSEDLKQRFSLPFDKAFLEFEPSVKLPGIKDGKVRGILVSEAGDSESSELRDAVSAPEDAKVFSADVWLEKGGKAIYTPAMSFYFIPSKGWTGELLEEDEDIVIRENLPEHRQVMNFLTWLSGYINSPNVLAVRHNRRHDLVRSYGERGMYPPSSYYTFEPERTTTAVKNRLRGKLPTVEVKGYFRRAHWHRLAGGGSAWFGTAWVSPYRRRAPETHAAAKTEAA
jgi:hypothetical protein